MLSSWKGYIWHKIPNFTQKTHRPWANFVKSLAHVKLNHIIYLLYIASSIFSVTTLLANLIQEYQNENCWVIWCLAWWISPFPLRTELHFHHTKQINLTGWSLDQSFSSFLGNTNTSYAMWCGFCRHAFITISFINFCK